MPDLKPHLIAAWENLAQWLWPLLGSGLAAMWEPGLSFPQRLFRTAAGAIVAGVSAAGVVSGPARGGPDKNERPMPLQNYQLYGLEIDSGFTGTLDWSGGSLAGNLTGPVLNNSGVAPNITGAVGYVTMARGTATIPIGSGFKTVTPGAMAKPINADDVYVYLTCETNPDLSGVETVWAPRVARTATTFDITTSPFLNVTGQDLVIAWEVRTR